MNVEFKEINDNTKTAIIKNSDLEQLPEFLKDKNVLNVSINFPDLKKVGDSIKTRLTGDVQLIEQVKEERIIVLFLTNDGSILGNMQDIARITPNKPVKVTLDKLTDEISSNGKEYQKKQTSWKFE